MTSHCNSTTPQAPEGLTREDATKTILDIDVQQQESQRPHFREVSNGFQEPQQYSSNAHVYPPIPNLPPITFATSSSPPSLQHHYITQAAEVTAHANIPDPLNLIFQTEKLHNALETSSRPDPSTLLSLYTATNTTRFTTKIASGSLVVESGGFAAVACWTPPSHSTSPLDPAFLDNVRSEGRMYFAEFLTRIEWAKEKHMYPVSERYWHLNLMARHPRREYVPGAVRGVVQPFLEAAEREQVPIWLEAGSERARDVYAHFGFEVCEVVVVGSCKTFCMMKR